jgi:hypothetical protein
MIERLKTSAVSTSEHYFSKSIDNRLVDDREHNYKSSPTKITIDLHRIGLDVKSNETTLSLSVSHTHKRADSIVFDRDSVKLPLNFY